MFTVFSFSYTSLEYLIFFLCVYFVYAIAPRRLRAAALALAGLGFAALLEPLSALFALALTMFSYLAGYAIGMCRPDRRRQRTVLAVSLIAIFGLLFAMKYAQSFLALLVPDADLPAKSRLLSSLLPAGISYYSFTACGYLIDVCCGERRAELNIIEYAAFLLLFPCFAAGPIGRSQRLLPQIEQLGNVRVFDAARIGSGATLMLWGYFLKLVVADRAAPIADAVFGVAWAKSSFALAVGAVAYSIQIYADFAGLSCIALGGAKIFGLDAIDNFDAPYLSGSVAEFWRRWHISLSGWLRDYLYIPLGGNRKGAARKYLNIAVVFAVCGIWHGGRVTFLLWGLLHGLYQLVGGVTANGRRRLLEKLKIDPASFAWRVWRAVCTFSLVSFAWIFFRAESLGDAAIYISRLFTRPDPWSVFNGSVFKLGLDATEFFILATACAATLFVDILRYRRKENVSDLLARQRPVVRYALIGALLVAVLVFGRYGLSFASDAFIYAEF